MEYFLSLENVDPDEIQLVKVTAGTFDAIRKAMIDQNINPMTREYEATKTESAFTILLADT